MTQARLSQLYNGFWQQYSIALPKAVSHFPVRDSPFSVRQVGMEFSIEVAVDFKWLRFKSSAGARNIAVRIRGTKRCVYDRHDQSRVTASNVSINYFVRDSSRNESTLTLIRALHYDYEINPDSLRNHPIYHCQICNDLLGGEFFGRRDYTIKKPSAKVYQHVRIPTANMDMISVLLSIAADHSAPEEFEKVLKVYDDGKWYSELPHISHLDRFSPGTCFRSRAWYIGNKA